MTLRERLSGVGNMHVRSTPGPVDRALALLRRRPDRWFLRGVSGRAALAELAADVGRVAPPATGPRVLVLALRYMPDHLAYETVIAQALRMRGADVTLLTCGGGMPICEVGWGREGFPRPCDRCGWQTDQVARRSGIRVLRLADTLPWGRDPRAAPVDGTGEDSRALASVSAPWFLRAADPAAVPEGARAVRDFEVTVDGVLRAADTVLDDVRPDAVFMLNGLFAAERAIATRARARGLRVATYEIAPRAGMLVFSQDRPAPDYDTDAAWTDARDLPLTPEQDAALDAQLLGRVAGDTSHERYFDAPEDDTAVLRRELGIPDGSRVVSLFTNLSWDSACIDHDVAYPSMLDWMAGAVRAAEAQPDITLVIRVHPAELRWGTRERAEDGLRERVGDLPANVRFVGPGEALSSYALLELSDLVLAYTTTVGLEAAVRAIPVAVAGETHYRGRGFTTDLASHDDLVAAVAAPARRLSAGEVALARRYAFTFFFRSMLPLPPVSVTAGHVTSVATDAGALAPGADPYVDWICDRLLDGGRFTLPDPLALPASPPAPTPG